MNSLHALVDTTVMVYCSLQYSTHIALFYNTITNTSTIPDYTNVTT